MTDYYFIRTAMMVLFLGAMLDCLTTNLALSKSGAREGNPVMAFIMRLTHSKWVLVRLAFALVGAAALARTASLTLPVIGGIAIQQAVTWYAVISNWLLYQRLRKG